MKNRSIKTKTLTVVASIAVFFCLIGLSSMVSAADEPQKKEMLSLTRAEPSVTPYSDYSGDFLNRATITGDWVVGFTFDHYLYMPKASKGAANHNAQFDKEPEGVGVFLRFHNAPEDRNPWNMFVSGAAGGARCDPGPP